ncbi:hypothetical protein [Bacillus sp. NEB1478]|uniref:hypothetical protein n=1 Tax=Bacillus sp. NEB1478 TaxID=3073816 RepID=UPI002873A1C3|nr:hypothetical protein [Bacillus sp. NEB1478]WNB92480.1 hypothetical protein RGB74_02105 [Bacillus sp. NEB1478]
MIRLGDGVYMCHLNGHQLKIIYKGNDICELYLENEFQGRASFQYVKKKLSELEKKWGTHKVKNYHFKELLSNFDQSI